MAAVTDYQSSPESNARVTVLESNNIMATPDIHNAPLMIQRAKEVYSSEATAEKKPTKLETLLWCLYDLCSYSTHTVLIPIVFPLIIGQIMDLPPPPSHGWLQTDRGISCSPKETQLYEGLVHRSVKAKFSSLEWTALSWFAGLILASPLLGYIATHLDHGSSRSLIFSGATAVGALFCLPVGFFNVTGLFPLYTVAIMVAHTIATASHTRHLGLMVRAFTGSTVRKSRFSDRQAVSSRLSQYSTAAGCVGAAIISAFTYHMLHGSVSSGKVVNLWVVSIFTGLKWFTGVAHAGTANRPAAPMTILPATRFSAWVHLLSIFRYPHAAGSLTGVFLSSFTTMCVFTGGLLFVVGHLCVKPTILLLFWLIYFISPLVSLPVLQPLQQLIKADAVRMQLLGFLVTALTSGTGFYFRHSNWPHHLILTFAALQGTATGILHAFGRVLLLDCSPPGKEGAFSVWFAWMRAVGTCLGFGIASTFHGNVSKSFSVAFCTTIIGSCVLIFGKISSFGGALAAGHVREDASEPVRGLDVSGVERKGTLDEKMEDN